ncbi:MAG: carboxypeptidase regulatory-like domain-containing protein, partial [Planctomycetia bacterium]
PADATVFAPVPEDLTPASAAPPAASPPTAAVPSWDARRFAVVLYALGLLLLSARLAVGATAAERLKHSSAPTPEWVEEIARRTAATLRRPIVPVRTTDRLATPALCGLFRPTILLPAAMLDGPSAANDVRGAIAHEAAHAAAADLRWDFFLAVVAAVLWPHPLAWRMHSAHRAACERVGDSVAADLLGDVPAYQSLLARLALRACGVAPAVGLAMARRSDIRDRLAALSKNGKAGPLGRRSTVAAMLVAAAVALLGVGSLAVRPSSAEPGAISKTSESELVSNTTADAVVKPAAANDAERARRPPTLSFTVVRRDDGSPVADAKIKIRMIGEPTFDDPNRPAGRYEVSTNAAGRAVFNYPAGDGPINLLATVKAPGLVPYFVDFGASLAPTALPTLKRIVMDRGRTIGGVVVDSTGRPIAGAEIEIRTPAVDAPAGVDERYGFYLLSEKTNADGRWMLDGAPFDLRNLQLAVNHPDFVSVRHEVQDAADARYVLDAGVTLTGRVTAADGKPIADAEVTSGDSRYLVGSKTTSTTADGSYALKGVVPDVVGVTVQAAGFSPRTSPVFFKREMKPIDFVLEPGRVVKFKFVTPEGEPLAGVRARVGEWRANRTLTWEATTAADGLATWTGAPPDEVVFNAAGPYGYAALQRFSEAAGPQPTVVVVPRPLKLSGTVVDEQGKPIPAFTITVGTPGATAGEANFFPGRSTPGRAGRFEIESDSVHENVYLRVEAPGFSVWTSAPIVFKNERQAFAVRMQPVPAAEVKLDEKQNAPKATDLKPKPARLRPPALNLTVVRRDDGAAVAGAEITVSTYGDPVADPAAPPSHEYVVTTDAAGRAVFPYPDGDRSIMVRLSVRKAGLVEEEVNLGDRIAPAALPTTKTVAMDRGAKVAGSVVDAPGKPIVNATVTLLAWPKLGSKIAPALQRLIRIKTTTDAVGGWSTDTAPPDRVDDLMVEVDHPEFTSAYGRLKDQPGGRFALQRGVELSGRVVGEDGKPAAGATVYFARNIQQYESKTVKTGADGVYAVKGLPADATTVVVHAPGKAPQMKTIDLRDDAKTLDFTLAEGKTIRFKIVNQEGEPLTGARVTLSSWQGQQMLDWAGAADAAGRVEWKGAPVESAGYAVFSPPGYPIVQRKMYRWGDEPHVIVVPRYLKAVGTVTDLKGGKVPAFRVAVGERLDKSLDIDWRYVRRTAGVDGRFEVSIDPQGEEKRLRIEADGFAPWTSDRLPTMNPLPTFDVKLEAAPPVAAAPAGPPGPAGVVYLPDGRPAAEAAVLLDTFNARSPTTQQSRVEPVSTDDAGRFQFPTIPKDVELADDGVRVQALHEEGFAELSASALVKEGELRLKPWGRVEVQVFRKGKPLVNGNVSVQRELIGLGYGYLSLNSSSRKTDADGRTVVERVAPGETYVYEMVSSPSRGSFSSSVQSAKLVVEPGKTTKVLLGGEGATVVGRFSIAGRPPAPHDWTKNRPIRIKKVTTGAADEENSVGVFVAADGSFEADGLPPGRYRLYATLTAASEEKPVNWGAVIGRVSREFEVPAGQAKVDLGVVEGKWNLKE